MAKLREIGRHIVNATTGSREHMRLKLDEPRKPAAFWVSPQGSDAGAGSAAAFTRAQASAASSAVSNVPANDRGARLGKVLA